MRSWPEIWHTHIEPTGACKPGKHTMHTIAGLLTQIRGLAAPCPAAASLAGLAEAPA